MWTRSHCASHKAGRTVYALRDSSEINNYHCLTVIATPAVLIPNGSFISILTYYGVAAVCAVETGAGVLEAGEEIDTHLFDIADIHSRV